MVFLLALAVGLVLADSSVVTLALPDILRDLDTSVGTVAWVLIAFNLALALAALPGARLARGRAGAAFTVSLALFALASATCAAAPSMAVLIGARVAQGMLGAVAVAAALELLVARLGGRRAVGVWAAAGVLGAALGPAAGGFLTEAFSWQAMFALQAPVALLALAGARRAPQPAAVAAPSARPSLVALSALALVSAALAAALFLLVLLLIEGWRHTAGEAALTVTVMPIAALIAGRWARAHDHGLGVALAGCVLIAGGLAALGLLPGAGPGWTLAPQLAIGTGLGLALAALIGVAIGNDPAQSPAAPASWTIAARHAGVVAGLLILTPIFTADLDATRQPAERAGLAQLLDAPLSLDTKLDLARTLEPVVSQANGELPDLSRGFREVDVPAKERAALARLKVDLDDQIDRAGTDAFSRSFLAAALLALLAAAALGAALVASGRPSATGSTRSGAGPPPGDEVDIASSNGSRLTSGAPLRAGAAAAATAATVLVAAYVALGGGDYKPAAVANPCAPRQRAAGLGDTQHAALATLDGAACRLHIGREALLLALLDGRLPPGVNNARLTDALRAGVDRARDERALSALEATGLRLAIGTRGPAAIIGLFLGK